MKKFLMTLAAVALATGAIMAQTPANNTALEEPDRIQTRHLSMNPSGTDIPTGYDKPQAVAQKHEQCKGHMDGQQCDKPADQQCDDCKAKAAAAQKHECKKGEGQQCKAAMKHECKKGEGQQCDKAAMKHECKKGEGQQCDKAAMKHECKKGEGQKCDKPADQQCDDCKAKAAAAQKHECKQGAGHQCDKAAADKSNVKAVKKSGKMMIKKDGKNDIKRDGAKDLKKESPKIPKKD